jgi:hypothetical protein
MNMWDEFEPEYGWEDIGALIIAIIAFVIYTACIAGFMYMVVHFVIKYW